MKSVEQDPSRFELRTMTAEEMMRNFDDRMLLLLLMNVKDYSSKIWHRYLLSHTNGFPYQ